MRSGRKLDRQTHRAATTVVEESRSDQSGQGTWQNSPSANAVGGGEEQEEEGEAVMSAKSIYMVSDGTGWTAEHSVNAALGQFDHCLVDRGCPVNTHLFSGVTMSFSFPSTLARLIY